MSSYFDRGRYAVPVDEQKVRSDWEREGFSFGIFRDPPAREWNDFVHDTDEYVVVASGELEITVGDETCRTGPGDLVRIPGGVGHSVKTVSPDGSVWLYGYGLWSKRS